MYTIIILAYHYYWELNVCLYQDIKAINIWLCNNLRATSIWIAIKRSFRMPALQSEIRIPREISLVLADVVIVHLNCL